MIEASLLVREKLISPTRMWTERDKRARVGEARMRPELRNGAKQGRPKRMHAEERESNAA